MQAAQAILTIFTAIYNKLLLIKKVQISSKGALI